MMNELGEIVEAFKGEGSFEKSIQEDINDKIGLDLKEDLLAHLTGRVTYCQWMEPPIKLNSQVNVIALEIENLEEFEKSLEAVIDRINQGEDGDDDAEERIEETDYKGVRVWAQPIAKIEERIERRKERFRKRREKQAGPDGEDRKSFTELAYGDLSTPQPSFALIGSYLVFSPQSKIFLEHAIDTDQGDSEPLAEDAKFKTINDKLANLLKNELTQRNRFECFTSCITRIQLGR